VVSAGTGTGLPGSGHETRPPVAVNVPNSCSTFADQLCHPRISFRVPRAGKCLIFLELN
jgi:hypothetical protein